MAGGLQLPTLPANCAPCQQLQSTLQNCQACGQNCGTCSPGCPNGEHPQPCGPGETIDPQTNCCIAKSCPPGEHLVPCGPNEVIDPQTGCCKPSGSCPVGEHAQPCGAGETFDPQTNCCIPATCPPGEHKIPCASNEVIDPQTGCCEPGLPPPKQCACPAGDYNLPLGAPCPVGSVPDPLSPPGCNCCKPSIPNQCACPSGDYNLPVGTPCPAGTSADPLAPPGCDCCKPTTPGLCPPGEPPSVQGQCPQTNQFPDPQNPGCCLSCPAGDIGVDCEHSAPCPPGYMNDAGNACCCKPACPAGDTPAPCGTGYAADPQFPNCCKPEAVEACFICPGGLPDLANALQGMPNTCYLASQMFLPPGGALPAPA